MSSQHLPIGIYHEHPEWFRPLFTELENRGIEFERIDAGQHFYSPADRRKRYSLFINRMSPSASLRGNGHAIFYTLNYLRHLEHTGTRIINGEQAFAIETSKAYQLSLLESLGLPYPKTRVIHHAAQAVSAAEGLRFPVVVKANIGGSGAGITRFETGEDLRIAAKYNLIQLGIDQTALVQEFVPARGGTITRVETLGGKFLYAIRVHLTGDTFNLCPADICQTADGKDLIRSACPADAPKSGLKVEAYTPPKEVIAEVERIVQQAHLDVGGIEYLIDDRDGKRYYYDINALSNFVADAVTVIGFNPFERLVDYLETEAQLAQLNLQEA